MTLVVSEVSKHGIVMVGDSAITIDRQDGTDPIAVGGASKVQYSRKANVGFAMWGYADVRGKRLDLWMDEFIRSEIEEGEEMESIGQRLTNRLKNELEQMGLPWCKLRFGIHMAGYQNGLPRLWHIHCGHSDFPYNEPPHEPRLYHDIPADNSPTDDWLWRIQEGAAPHLRNGYWRHYAKLYDAIRNDYGSFHEYLKIKLPKEPLEGRLEFHKILVRLVAGLLSAVEPHPAVNNELSSVAFTNDGLKIDERLPLIEGSSIAPKFPVTEIFMFRERNE